MKKRSSTTSDQKGFTVNALSVSTGIDRRTLKRRLETATPDASGRYRAEDVLPLLKTVPRETNDKRAAEVRKLIAQAERIEFDNSVRRGEHAHLDDIRREWKRGIGALKSRLLNDAPARIATTAVVDLKIPPGLSPALKKLVYDEMIESLRYLSGGEWVKDL